MRKTTPDLFHFSTAEPGNPLFCHQDFLQKVEENKANGIGKRAAFLLQRLVVDESRLHYKSTRGPNKGWRRSRLGGNHGSHYYAWWAPKGAPPLKGHPEFEAAPRGAIFLRDIRHHDDHSELKPQSLDDNYLTLSARELRGEEYVPSPWTTAQAKFALSRQRVRIVKGFPGSGKTSALWQATDLTCSGSALYVTYSKDLAALAKAHFQRFSPDYKNFRVLTYGGLIRELLGLETEPESERTCRAQFVQQISGFSPRILGPWVGQRHALYDEIHAHLIGSALPVACGRFTGCNQPRLPDRTYRDMRRPYIGGAAADALLETVRTLEKREGEAFYDRFFPELMLAWKASRELAPGERKRAAAAKLLWFDCIAVDEVQDLTPLEAFVLVRLACAAQAQQRGPVSLLIAGDEAQTVRPTEFEWGWLHDIIFDHFASPSEFRLTTNLRSPRRIARLVNRVWDLYAHLAKQDRPGGLGETEIDDEASDQVVYCAASRGPELERLLTAFGEREGLAVICLDERIPDYVPTALKHKVLSVFEAKGLDFQAVCILDPGKHLDRILREEERMRRETPIVPLGKRLAIDQLRVAVSRPTERLYLLDVGADEATRKLSMAFLSAAEPDGKINPAIPDSVLKGLEEEALEPEERVRLCEADARQFLSVKPELAWTRAKQAVALLGRLGDRFAVTDETVRRSAHLTLCQVAFCLAIREVKLPPELGDPDFYEEAAAAAEAGGRRGLMSVIEGIQVLGELFSGPRPALIADLVETLEKHRDEVEPWLTIELSSKSAAWVRELEEAVSDLELTARVVGILPAAYRVFDVPDGKERAVKVRAAAVESLMAAEKFAGALYLLEQTPDPSPKLLARCYEGLKEHRKAAEFYLEQGSRKDALRNFRAVPDIDKAIELSSDLEAYPAAESLEWLRDLRSTLAKRPANFARVATEAEKKFLQEMLESSLDGPRRKPAPRKAGRPRKRPAPKE